KLDQGWIEGIDPDKVMVPIAQIADIVAAAVAVDYLVARDQSRRANINRVGSEIDIGHRVELVGDAPLLDRDRVDRQAIGMDLRVLADEGLSILGNERDASRRPNPDADGSTQPELTGEDVSDGVVFRVNKDIAHSVHKAARVHEGVSVRFERDDG